MQMDPEAGKVPIERSLYQITATSSGKGDGSGHVISQRLAIEDSLTMYINTRRVYSYTEITPKRLYNCTLEI